MLNLEERTNEYVICDANKCIGCYTCMAACYETSKERGKTPKARLTVYNTAHGTMPNQCHQCDDAPCANICPVGALSFANNKIELYEEKCIGCKMCTVACPFGCISVDCQDEDVSYFDKLSLLRMPKLHRSIAVKCDLCEGREGGGHACVDVCPTDALMFVTPQFAEHMNKTKAFNTMQI